MRLAQSSDRVVGVDLARWVALVAMFVAHTAPSAGPANLLAYADFLAAPLFAVLLGAAARFSSSTMSFPALFASSVVRGIALVALGLYLGTWGAQVDIVLQYLGVLAIVIAPLVFLPTWALGLIGAAAWWVAPLASTYFVQDAAAAASAGWWRSYAYDWLVTGQHYQVLTLLVYACVGALLASGLERWGAAGDAAVAVAATGALAAVFWYLPSAGLTLVPYSVSRIEIAVSLLLATASVGWCCLLARAVGSKESLVAPLLYAGRMTLTLYVLQIAVLAAYSAYAPGYGWPASDDSWYMLAGLVVGASLFALVWRHFLGATALYRGPLETILALLTGRG